MTRPGPSSNFYSAIYQLTARIPPGAVATYGQLAFLAGHPRASRIAGGAMAQAPVGLPCHRVVTKEGRISPAFGPGPDNRQARRLREEGVQVRDGFVDMEEFQWKKWIF